MSAPDTGNTPQSPSSPPPNTDWMFRPAERNPELVPITFFGKNETTAWLPKGTNYLIVSDGEGYEWVVTAEDLSEVA